MSLWRDWISIGHEIMINPCQQQFSLHEIGELVLDSGDDKRVEKRTAILMKLNRFVDAVRPEPSRNPTELTQDAQMVASSSFWPWAKY